MNRAFLAAGVVAVGCAAPIGANAQSCPPGQIFRVSMGICQPRSSDNSQWLKNGDRKSALRPSSGKPAVGDVVLFGSSAPTLLKPVAPKSAAKAMAPKRAVANAPASRKAVAAVPQPAAEPADAARAATGEASELHKRETEVAARRNASLKVEDAVVPEVKPPERARVSAPPPVVGTSMQPNAAPSAATEPPVQTTSSMAAVEPPTQVRTIPLYQTPTPNPPAVPSGAPDWGDEKKLVEVLRAAWKETVVTRTFRRGEEVPADIPLQQLPPSFASRDAGVNMHYLIANGDAVLVLPGMRVVVEIYHSSTASLK